MKHIQTAVINDREYQTLDRANIEKAWSESNRVLYQLPTGGGKSVVMKGIMKDYIKEDQIVFAHKKRLIVQLEAHLKSIGVTPGILMGTRKENLDAKIVIASIRTAVKDKNLTTLVQRKWKKAYIDEARHSRTTSYDTVIGSLVEALPEIKLLGVDATPFRKDKKRLDRWFEVMVTSVEDVKSLQDKGFLARMRTYATPIKDMKEEVDEVAGDYQKEQLSKFMRKPMYLNYVVQNYLKRGEGRQALGFAVDIQHAKDLVEVFKNNGITKTAVVSSELSDDEIEEVFEQYEDGRIQVLWNVEMVTEGVDLPETRCIIGARPTKSLTLYLQMAGRGTRPKDDNGDCILLDCCGWTNGVGGNDTGFGTIDSPKHWSLNPEIDPNNPRKKNKIVGKKADGTFTEDPEEFDELIEMSPEEYFKNLSGGIERAEKHNLSIEEQIEAVQLKINELFAKVPDEKVRLDFDTISVLDDRNFMLTVTYFLKKHRTRKRNTAKDDIIEEQSERPFDTWDTPYGQIQIGHGRPLVCTLECYRKDFAKMSNAVTSYLKTMALTASANHNLQDSKSTIKQIFEYYEEILDLKKARIDIKELQATADKFKEEEWQKKVGVAVKKGDWLELPKELSEGDFFKATSHTYNYIQAVKINGEQINGHHNKIVLRMLKKAYWRSDKPTVEEVEKNYVKGERIWEILKAGEYQPKTQDNEEAKS